MAKARKITVTLTSWQSEEDLNKVLEEIFWDSKYSYEFDTNEWEIIEMYQEPDPEQKHWDDLATWNERFTD